jgi:hypothetical protein
MCLWARLRHAAPWGIPLPSSAITRRARGPAAPSVMATEHAWAWCTGGSSLSEEGEQERAQQQLQPHAPAGVLKDDARQAGADKGDPWPVWAWRLLAARESTFSPGCAGAPAFLD